MSIPRRPRKRRHPRGWLVLALCAGVWAVASAAPATVGASDPSAVSKVAPPLSGPCTGPTCDNGPWQGITLEPSAVVPLTGDASTCDDSGACLWQHTDFDGDMKRLDQGSPVGDWYSFNDGFFWHSAKNRFGDRKVKTGNVLEQTGCMDPNENRPSLIYSDRFYIGGLGSRCGS
jgi:Peptidase inhibitor family I36